MFSTLKGRIEKFVSQAKRNKGRDIIGALWSLLAESPKDIRLNYRKLEQDVAAGALRPPEFASIPMPTDVKPVSRLAGDIKALLKLFEPTTPPQTCGIRLREGTWGSDSEDESSNWREYTNLVEFLEEEAALGNLSEATVIICTDNRVTELAANRGTSSSKKLLFDLTLRLHALEMKYSLK
eukprot:scaffold109938_cov58-Attheya_sp.AAC.3